MLLAWRSLYLLLLFRLVKCSPKSIITALIQTRCVLVLWICLHAWFLAFEYLSELVRCTLCPLEILCLCCCQYTNINLQSTQSLCITNSIIGYVKYKCQIEEAFVYFMSCCELLSSVAAKYFHCMMLNTFIQIFF
jgi:hypothetical protein